MASERAIIWALPVLTAGLVASGCGAAEVPLSVSAADATGDAQRGPGASEDGAPPGVDLVRVTLTVANEHLVVHFESTEPIEGSATGELRRELQRGWWWVRFWNHGLEEAPTHLLSVWMDPMGIGDRSLSPLFCEMDRLGYCSEEHNLLGNGEGSVQIEGVELAVAIPVESMGELRPPFQWAAWVTLNTTRNMAEDWWDFVPDWPKGDEIERAHRRPVDGGLDLTRWRSVHWTESQHPDPDGRAWFGSGP